MADFDKFIKGFDKKPMEDYTEDEVEFYYNWLDDQNGWDGYRYEKTANGEWAITEPDNDEPTYHRTFEDSKFDLHELRAEAPDFNKDFLQYRKKKGGNKE